MIMFLMKLLEMIFGTLEVIIGTPIGLIVLFIAIITSVLMCKYASRKARIICVLSLLIVLLICVAGLALGNSDEGLLLIILILPFFVTMAIAFSIYDVLDILVNKKNRDDDKT